MFRFQLKLIIIFLLVALTGDNLRAVETQKYPPRLKRSECFLGVHFDFHAGNDCKEIGKNVDGEMIEYIIDQVHPDYLQTDCKGHPGLSSYPTKVGNPAPGFVKDTLKIWREVTARRGVGLYLHYSGVWDSTAVKQHPDWVRVDEKGKRDDRIISVFGPYVNELLIPQLKELSDNYQVDGMWVDGECWATECDYADNVIELFQKQTGIKNIPRKRKDSHWYEFSEFCRQGFRDYLNHYVTELHKHNPDFQIASNWAFTSMMPDPVTIDVDYISGDYSPQDSVNTARFEARCMVHQGKPWDLMAWSFTRVDTFFSTKTIPQLKREAAVVLALGGGFQAYFPQRRDGSVRKWQMKLMGAVAKFCRARQKFCHQGKPIPQIGLIYDTKAFYRQNNKLFSPGGILYPLRGILQALLESQNVVDVVMDHQLRSRMQDYPLLIYPEWNYIDPDFKAQLLAYVKEGGNLLIIGPGSAALFEKELNVELLGKPVTIVNGLEHNSWVAGLKTTSQKVKLSAMAQPYGKINSDNDLVSPLQPAASITSYGRGKIAATYINLGERYKNSATTVARNFLNDLVRKLFPDPLVEVTGSHYVDVIPTHINGKLALNLVNTAGPHSDSTCNVHDDIPPVGPLHITIRYSKKPQKVTLQPAGEPLSFQYQNGKISLNLPLLKIYDIILVD